MKKVVPCESLGSAQAPQQAETEASTVRRVSAARQLCDVDRIHSCTSCTHDSVCATAAEPLPILSIPAACRACRDRLETEHERANAGLSISQPDIHYVVYTPSSST